MLTVWKEVTRLHSKRPHHRPLLIEGKFPDFTHHPVLLTIGKEVTRLYFKCSHHPALLTAGKEPPGLSS